MAYTVNVLTTVAECDQRLTTAGQLRAVVLNRQQNLLLLITQLALAAPQALAELQGTTATLNGIVTMLTTLPEGPAKVKYETEKERLEYQQQVLARRVDTNGPMALLDRELDLGRITAELIEIDAFIAAVQARRAVL